MRLLSILAAACVLLLVAALPAGAVVPPRNCGMTTVKGKRYNIKSDQLSCSTAKRHSRRYLGTGRRPSGYRCKNYRASQTALRFRCERGSREFFAIRR